MSASTTLPLDPRFADLVHELSSAIYRALEPILFRKPCTSRTPVTTSAKRTVKPAQCIKFAKTPPNLSVFTRPALSRRHGLGRVRGRSTSRSVTSASGGRSRSLATPRMTLWRVGHFFLPAVAFQLSPALPAPLLHSFPTHCGLRTQFDGGGGLAISLHSLVPAPIPPSRMVTTLLTLHRM